MHNSKKTAALGAIVLLIGGCNAPAGGGAATLPDGETDLSCAALIFAATNLLDNQGISTGDYLAVMTRYGTAYATSKGIGADEALGQVKLEAYRLTGKAPGASAIPADTIARRAKACMGS